MEVYLKDTMLCRRMFLKSSALFAATLLGAKSAFAKLTEGGGLPEGKLSLYNVNNHERLSVTYRNSFGEYCAEALQSLNWILRCHNTNEVTHIDVRVLEYLNRLNNALGGGHEIQIISGYRSPSYNHHLRGATKGVAKNSLHMKGMAIDLAIPGVGLDMIRRTARALASGGVGYYPTGGFVHIDSGGFRAWQG
jgi:uncharacterized protein YcbK (DUF882 family)